VIGVPRLAPRDIVDPVDVLEVQGHSAGMILLVAGFREVLG
jgi:hypothetical protein